MPFAREINRLLAALLLAFAAVGMAAAYWAVTGPDSILNRGDNPRRVLAEASILRGALYDRDGELLARTVRGPDGMATRAYPHPETHGALGYYSFRYGAAGAEDAYNDLLRGGDGPADWAQLLAESLLHQPRRGGDAQLTLDLAIQSVLARAMGGHQGGAVVLSVPAGDVLAMVSLPTYDPNRLDADWDRLRAEPGKPFFNRALQAGYQPGAAMQTPLLAAALIGKEAITTPRVAGTAPVDVGDVRLTCAVRLPSLPLSLRDAYAFSCPRPFADMATALGPGALESTFAAFRLLDPPALDGFTESGAITAPWERESHLADPDAALAAALGQGELTLSPLTLATITAGIVNDGNAPTPRLLLATRAPGAEAWEPVSATRPTLPLATMQTARHLQDLMRYTAAVGAAQNASRPALDIGGHAAVAYSGEGPLTWFTGFLTLPGRQGVAIALVLESVADTGLAADIGGEVLAAAAAELRPPAAE